jgi:UDP-N-acetylmuramate--alanine ligase
VTPEGRTESADLGRVHLVGIGGAGMSGIARVLLARGTRVSGSDARDSRTTVALRALGATVHLGHAAEHVAASTRSWCPRRSGRTTRSSPRARARPAGAAARRGARRADDGRRGVAVAGTHGKTTTTVHADGGRAALRRRPVFAIGGDLNEAASNAHHGSGELFVVEADESDGSFLAYRPYAAIVTNVEPDHLDHYGDAAAVDRAFEDFVTTIEPGGFLVACADDEGSLRLAEHARSGGTDVRTYGTSADADLRLDAVTVSGSTSRYQPVLRGRRLSPVELVVPGRHLALNSGAALLTGIGLGLPAERLIEGLAGFTGVRRRMELKGTVDGVRVYDDYAHHPTEVTAQLAAAREVAGGGRVVVAFQPHRYSRTLAFAEAFGVALGGADEVVVMEVYAAGERPVPGASGATVAAAVPLPPDRVCFEPSWTAVPQLLASRAEPGDLVLTLGAGDVTAIGPEVLRVLSGAAE